MKKIDLIIYLLVCVVSLFTLRDLYKPYFYTSHDGPNQIVRMYYFDSALNDGQFPPRIAGGLLNGYSYPLFIFSYHMPWIIAEPFYLITRDIFGSIKFSFFVGYLLSGITMYWYLKRVFGRFPALIGVLLYLYAPYRFVNIFVRAAIGDATSFIFPPLFFLSMYELSKYKTFEKLKTEGKKWIVMGGIGVGGLILSHAMVFVLFGLFYFLYLVWNMILSTNKRNNMISFTSVIIFGITLSGYYFIPSFLERNYTRFSSVMGGIFTGSTFITLKQLIYSPWGYGMMRAEEGGMSFQIGIAQLAAVLFAFLVLIYSLVKRAEKNQSSVHKLGLYFLVTFILSVVAMLPASLFAWKLLSNIVVIDFTWRILAVTVFSSSVLGAFAVSQIKYKYLFGVFIILIALYTNRNHLRINQIQDWDVPFYLKLVSTTNMYDEYTPKWVEGDIGEIKVLKKVNFPSAEISPEVKINTSNHLLFTAKSLRESEVVINTIYYPGWELYINGLKKPIEYKNTSGLINFKIPQGNNTVELKFKETPLRLLSDFVTIISVMISLWVIIGWFKKSYQKHEVKNI